MMPVAVTGIGLVTPLGASREASWRALRKGACGLRALPGELFEDAASHAGGLPPVDVSRSSPDRFVQYAVAAAMEALKDSGQVPGGGARRTGVVVGSSKGGVVTLLKHAPSPRFAPADLFVQAGPCAASARVAAELDLAGPVLSESASCATGVACLSRAVDLIRDGRCEAVLAGSSDASLTPLILAGFQNLGALSRARSPADACKAFDRDRSGFLVGEGAAVFMLEPLDRARDRRVHVYGVLAGLALACEAYHETRPDPCGSGLLRCILAALGRAGLTREHIDYVNAHGTGTSLGDVAEARAILSGFGREARVSSTKPQTGHLLGASSSVGIAFMLLSLRDGWVPGTRNLSTPDADCAVNLVPPVGLSVRPRCVAGLSAGFGGQAGVAIIRHGDHYS